MIAELIKYYGIDESSIEEIHYNVVLGKNVSYRKINVKYNKWYWLIGNTKDYLHGCDSMSDGQSIYYWKNKVLK